MLFRALLISLLIHAIFLLGSPAERAFTRLEGHLIGVPGVLKERVGDPSSEVPLASRSMTPARSTGGQRSLAGATPPVRAGRVAKSLELPSGQPRPDILSPMNVDEGADDALRQYRLQLARAARLFVQAHVSAYDYAGDGKVLVLVRLDAQSAIVGVELGASSGNSELDAGALALVTRAVRMAVIPDALRGRSLVLELPIRYSSGEE